MWRHMSDRLPGTAEASEDLPPDGIVPVAEGAPRRVRVGGPGAAEQPLVVRSEEDLRILPGGEGPKTRAAVEVGGGPLPDVPDQLPHAVGRRALPIAPRPARAEPALAEIGTAGLEGVAPRVAAGPLGHRVPACRLLPLRLGGQP